MTITETFVNAAIKVIARVLLRFDPEPLKRVPTTGPALIVSNHTTNLEGPLVFVFLRPRPISGLAKTELWGNPITRFLMEIWRMIPITRGRMDTKALARADQALKEGYFLGVAPEGTRSKNGTLGKGQPGTALLASTHSYVIVPVAQWGLHEFGENIRRWRRTPFNVRVGTPFRLKKAEGRPHPAVLRQMTDEIMYQIAILLPERYRGAYSDLGAMTTDYVVPV